MDYSSVSYGFLLVLGLYFTAILAYLFRVIFFKPGLSVLAFRLTVIGFATHLVVFIPHLLRQGYPYLVSSFENLQLISLMIIFIFILLCLFYKFSLTGVVMIPLSVIFYIRSLGARPSDGKILELVQNPWAFVHLTSIFMSMAVFMVSFIVGLIYIASELRIKNKKRGGIFDRFPSLETLDTVHYRALWIGFIIFTIGIITGAGWSKSTLGVYVSTNMQQLLSLAAWIFFAVFLNLRVPQGWIGRRGVVLSSVGFVALIILIVLS